MAWSGPCIRLSSSLGEAGTQDKLGGHSGFVHCNLTGDLSHLPHCLWGEERWARPWEGMSGEKTSRHRERARKAQTSTEGGATACSLRKD